MRYVEVSVARVGPAAAARAGAEALAGGRLVAHPTAAVYGLGGPADPGTDAEIGRLKGRSAGPLLRLAPDLGAARRLHPAAVWSEAALRLAATFWPGPLTLVLDDGTPEGFAVRVEGHPVARALLDVWGGLMSSTSLNRSGEPPAQDTAGARRALRTLPESERGAVFLECGSLPGGPPSTLLSLRGGVARVLREGAVPSERLRRAVEGLGVWEPAPGGETSG